LKPEPAGIRADAPKVLPEFLAIFESEASAENRKRSLRENRGVPR
jgi:hypothetical protein